MYYLFLFALPLAGVAVVATMVDDRISPQSAITVMENSSTLELALIGIGTLWAYALSVRRRRRGPGANDTILPCAPEQASSLPAHDERPNRAA